MSTIKLKGGSGAPGSLADGEIALDEAAGVLYTKSTGGIDGTPLDIAPLPAAGVSGQVLLQGLSGPEWGLLSAGAGGRPFDARTWRVPGLIPTGVTQIDAVAGEVAVFEVAESAHLIRLHTRVISGAGSMQLVIAPYDGTVGSPVVDEPVSVAGPGDYEVGVDVVLPVGRYAAICEAVASETAGALMVQVVQGLLPWSSTFWRHGVWMEFT
jgi:hypothetical protein